MIMPFTVYISFFAEIIVILSKKWSNINHQKMCLQNVNFEVCIYI